MVCITSDLIDYKVVVGRWASLIYFYKEGSRDQDPSTRVNLFQQFPESIEEQAQFEAPTCSMSPFI